MDGQVFTNENAVDRLQVNVCRFYSKVIHAVPRPIERADKIASALADRLNFLQIQVSHLLPNIDKDDNTASDDEVTRAQLEVTNAAISKIRLQLTQLEHARSEYLRDYRRCEEDAREHTSMVKNFLCGVRDDLNSYRAAELQAQRAVSLPAFHSTTTTSHPDTDLSIDKEKSVPVLDFTSFPLPSKFNWMHLDKVESTLDLPESTKISFHDLRTALKLLQAVILPTFIEFGPAVGQEWFYAQDFAKQGTVDYSLLKTYELFFGSDPIAIDRNASHSSYHITNGRHRIFVARQLGWVALPVIFTDECQS